MTDRGARSRFPFRFIVSHFKCSNKYFVFVEQKRKLSRKCSRRARSGSIIIIIIIVVFYTNRDFCYSRTSFTRILLQWFCALITYSLYTIFLFLIKSRVVRSRDTLKSDAEITNYISTVCLMPRKYVRYTKILLGEILIIIIIECGFVNCFLFFFFNCGNVRYSVRCYVRRTTQINIFILLFSNGFFKTRRVFAARQNHFDRLNTEISRIRNVPSITFLCKYVERKKKKKNVLRYL